MAATTPLNTQTWVPSKKLALAALRQVTIKAGFGHKKLAQSARLNVRGHSSMKPTADLSMPPAAGAHHPQFSCNQFVPAAVTRKM